MRYSIIKLFLFFTLSGLVFQVSAQPQSQPTQQQQQVSKSSDKRFEKRFNKLKTKLALTDEQAPKVKEILIAGKNSKKANKSNPEAAKASHKQMMADLGKILTPDQMTKLKQMHKKKKNKG